MLSILYVSSATKKFTKEELVELLRFSRERNEKEGITGMLLYKDGNIMQVIEGPDDAIHNLYARISKDPRHTDVTKLAEEPIIERQFADWSMGFSDVGALSPEELKGYSPFLQEDFVGGFFQDHPVRAYIMLSTFKKTIR